MTDVLIIFIGHGPFSHMFDALFIPTARPDSDWKVSLPTNIAVKVHLVLSIMKLFCHFHPFLEQFSVEY